MTIQVGGTSATQAQLASIATSLGVPADQTTAITGVTYNGSGQVTAYTQNGVTFTVGYVTVNSLSLPGIKTGGGHTTTYNYNSSGQLTSTTVS